MNAYPLLSLKAELDTKHERFIINRQDNESPNHWVLKLLMIQELIRRGFSIEDINLEKNVDNFRADIYASKYESHKLKEVWIECQHCPEERIKGILDIFAGSFIHIISDRVFRNRLKQIIQKEKEHRERLVWREIHKQLVLPKITLLSAYILGMPKIVYGIHRSQNNGFTFIEGSWRINDFHPQKVDRKVFLEEYDFIY